MSETIKGAVIGVVGVLVGGLLSGVLLIYSNSQQIEHERESRSFDIRLNLYAEFNNASLLMMDDFLSGKPPSKENEIVLNLALSKISLLGTEHVRNSAAKVHEVIAVMKVAGKDALSQLLN